jgi:HAD superfamily hydrolase (TIGR01509 family)
LGHRFEQEQLRTERRARFARLIATEEPRAGILAVLQATYERQVPVLCVSSSPHEWVDGHLERLGLTHFFLATLCLEDAPRAKPWPDLYEAALAHVGVLASDALAVEDTKNGIQAATAAGIYTIAYPNPVTVNLDLSAADRILTAGEKISKIFFASP